MGHRVALFNYATQERGARRLRPLPAQRHPDRAEPAARHRPIWTRPSPTPRRSTSAPTRQDAWASARKALAAAKAARAGRFGTQNQIDAPERALSYQLARLGVLKAADETGPVIEVPGVEDGGEYGDSGDLTLGWTAEDAGSGVKSLTATLDGQPVILRQ